MTDEVPYRLAALLLLVTLFSISGYYRRKADREGGTLNPAGDTAVMMLRLVGLVIISPLIAYLINPGWVAWAQFPAPSWLRWLGAAMTAVTVPLIYWLFQAIGSNISPSHTTRKEHQLVTSGPYRYIRHPLYTFGMVAWIGLGLLAALWWVLAGWVALLGFIAYRTPKEEAHLLAEFGEEYQAYMARTGRYIPRLGRLL